jgi:hypothetical protein
VSSFFVDILDAGEQISKPLAPVETFLSIRADDDARTLQSLATLWMSKDCSRRVANKLYNIPQG